MSNEVEFFDGIDDGIDERFVHDEDEQVFQINEIQSEEGEFDVSPSQSITPLPMQALKTVVITSFAALTSLSLPLFIIYMEDKLSEQDSISLEQKILTPLIPYLILVSLRAGLLWNSIGHRMNGCADAELSSGDETFEEAPGHMLAALLANTSSITNALLVAFVGLSEAPPAILWSGAFALGFLNYTADLLTDVVDASRKFVEYKQTQGHAIAPFFQQKFMGKFVHRHAENFGLVLRELLPVFSGVVRSAVTREAAASILQKTVSETTIKGLNVPIGLLAYWSTAYTTQFELIQLSDNFRAAGTMFNIENKLSQSSYAMLHFLGKVSSGQILIDAFKCLKLSTRTSVNLMLILSSVALTALLRKSLHEYVSSNNHDAVWAGEEGLLMSYCVGEKEALRLAPKIDVAIDSISCSLSTISMFTRAATLHKHACLRDGRIVPNHPASDDYREDVEVGPRNTERSLQLT